MKLRYDTNTKRPYIEVEDREAKLHELEQLDLVCRQIYKSTEDVDIRDRIAQVRQCLWGARSELEGCLQPDTEEFVNDVIRDARPRIEKVLIDIGACPSEEDVPDTERDPNLYT